MLFENVNIEYGFLDDAITDFSDEDLADDKVNNEILMTLFAFCLLQNTNPNRKIINVNRHEF